ncbi:MAG: PAS domain-containing sensor histidine kinase [Salibacteraceae bacterium]
MRKTIHLISQSGVSTPLPSSIELYESINNIINCAAFGEILVSNGFDFETNNTFIKTLNAHVKHNPLIIFSDKLSPIEISELIRNGVYVVYPQNEFKNLTQIVKKKTNEIFDFSNQNNDDKYLKLISKNLDEIIFEFEISSNHQSSWRLNYASRLIEEICGESRETCLSNQQLWWELLHPNDIDNFIRITKKSVLKRQIKTREYRIRHVKTGIYTWIRDTITPVFNDNTKVIKLYGVAKNIQKEKETELALEEANLFSENLFKTSPNILYVLDYNSGLMIQGLEKFASFLGFSTDEIKSMSDGVYSLIHEDDLVLVEQQEKQLADSQSDVVVPVEIRLKHKDGHFIWVNINSKVFKRNSDGIATHEIGSVADISKLKENEELFKGITLSSKAGILIIQDNKIRFANPATLQLLEFEQNELKDTVFTDIIDKEKIQEAIETHDDLISGRVETKRSGQLLKTKKGKTIEIEIISTQTTFQGKPAIISTFIDISYIKKAERTFKGLFDNSEDLIYIQSGEGKFIDVNNSVIKKYGYPKEKFIGETPGFLGYPGMNDIEKVKELTKQAWDEDKIVQFNWWGMKKDGSKFPKEVIIKPGYYFDQKVLIATGIDITDRQIADQEKSNLIEQLIEQNRDLEQFTYIISHNLRSPIVAILGLTQVLEIDSLSDENRELVEHITESTKGLDNIICDLGKTLSVRKHQDQIKEDCNLLEIIKKVNLTLSESINKSGVEFLIDVDDNLVFRSIKGYMQNIVYNLLSNAIKYRNKNVPLVIKIIGVYSPDQVVLKIEDNGIGLDKEKQGSKIFGLHERLHYHVDGKGIGLFLVKQQVDALGGKIDFESEVEKGTTFTVTIPL